MPTISSFLWFESQAEEAMNFYVSIFPGAKVLGVNRYGDGAPMPKGTVMTASFQLLGQTCVARNGGPHSKFTPAVSFSINCETQEEIDHYWSKLGDGGSDFVCGWLRDKYGLSWQVVPAILPQLLKDEAGGSRAMAALMKMTKLDIKTLKEAAAGGK